MGLFQKLKKKTDYKLEKVMVYAKITELKDRYMIYNAVKNERKWEDKKMELDNEELEATKKNREKKADDMFEELGFKRAEYNGSTHYEDLNNNYVSFDYELELFTCNCYLGIKEIQAINKKIEELGWQVIK